VLSKVDAAAGIRRAVLWSIAAYVLIFLTAVAGIAVFINAAGAQGDGLVLRFHLLLIGCSLLVLLWTESLLVGLFLKFSRLLAWCSGAVLALLHVALCIYYLALVMGLKSWGDVITQDLIVGFLPQVPTMLAQAPLAATPLLAAGALAALVLLAGHVFLAHRRIEALSYLSKSLYAGRPVRRIALRVAGFGLPAFLGFVTWNVYAEDAVFYSEPLACLIRNQTWRDATGARRLSVVDERGQDEARKAYVSRTPTDPLHVVLIVLDAARPDRMSAYGWPRPTTPFLEGLVKSGRALAIPHAYSPCANTACAVGAMLQSRLPHRLVNNGFGLPEVLAASGYRNLFLLSGDHTRFFSLRHYYGTKADFFIDGSTARPDLATDDERIFDTLHDLDIPPSQPTFLMLHLMSPHILGVRHAPFAQYLPDKAGVLDSLEAKKTAYGNNHDNGLLQTDDYIRRILALLDKKGVLQRSLVVIVSDHGESIGENGIFAHSQSIYEPEIRVPFVVIDPGRARHWRTVNVSLVDVAPTVVERLGLPMPSVWTGQSLLRETTRNRTLHQMGLYQGLIEWGDKGAKLKLVYHTRDRRSELYDLAADPGETRNIASSRPQDVNRLMGQLALDLGLVAPAAQMDALSPEFLWPADRRQVPLR